MFKPGDRIKRVGSDWGNVIQGKRYTVKACSTRGVLTLNEVTGSYDADLFALATPRVSRNLPDWF